MLSAQEKSSAPKNQIDFYLRLKQEEFLQTMISKEKVLVGLALSIRDEIMMRKSEGLEVSDMGLERLDSPDEVMKESFVEEMQASLAMLEQIEALEKKARQKANFEALEELSRLKKEVYSIIEGKESGAVAVSGDTSALLKTGSGPSGDISLARSSPDSVDPALYSELFEEWKANRILRYQVELGQYEYIRLRLLKTASAAQERRMFQRDLLRAISNYMSGNFQVSRLEFQDVMKTFSRYSLLDDVQYYACESSYGLNYFDEALAGYHRLISAYPDSPFSAKALVKIIFIQYIYDNAEAMHDAFMKLLPRRSNLDPNDLSTVAYLLGYKHFREGGYRNAMEALAYTPSSTPYFYPSLYLTAACYSNLGENDMAVSLYYRLVSEKKSATDPVLDQIKNNARLKLGFIYYEKGDHGKAAEFFNQVTADYAHYDLSLMGKAWNAFKQGMPGEALRTVQGVLNNSMISSYMYEARVLAASSKELMGYDEEAIEEYKIVYGVGKDEDPDASANSGPSIGERRAAGVPEDETNVDPAVLAEIMQIRRFLQGANPETEGWESGGEGLNGLYEGQKKLAEKIENLDTMEAQARKEGNAPLLDEIRRLRSDMIQTLEIQSFSSSPFSTDPEEEPIRRMGYSEYLKYIFTSLLAQTVREKKQTGIDIQEAEKLQRQAAESEQYEVFAQLEVNVERLKEYYSKLNQYEVWLRENFPQEFRVELDRWATFSGYGISDINFSRINRCDQKITMIAQSIDMLDTVFNRKRKQLEMRIDGLLMDVASIEEQMRRESEKKASEERDRFFKTDYFDKRPQENILGPVKELDKSKQK